MSWQERYQSKMNRSSWKTAHDGDHPQIEDMDDLQSHLSQHHSGDYIGDLDDHEWFHLDPEGYNDFHHEHNWPIEDNQPDHFHTNDYEKLNIPDALPKSFATKKYADPGTLRGEGIPAFTEPGYQDDQDEDDQVVGPQDLDSNATKVDKFPKSVGVFSSWQKRYAGIFDDVPEENYGTSQELEEAKSVGISQFAYNHLRSPNPQEHPSETSYEAQKYSIPSHKQVMEIGKLKIDPFDYDTANLHGFSHEAIKSIHQQGVNVGDYVEARKHGLRHEEVMSSKNLKGDIRQRYNDLVDAHKHGANLDDYSDARDGGATHSEIIDAHKHGAKLRHYSYARGSGATHSEIIDAHKNGANLYDYGYARRSSGATHSEIMDRLLGTNRTSSSKTATSTCPQCPFTEQIEDLSDKVGRSLEQRDAAPTLTMYHTFRETNRQYIQQLANVHASAARYHNQSSHSFHQSWAQQHRDAAEALRSQAISTHPFDVSQNVDRRREAYNSSKNSSWKTANV
jgi:hypothetical protein